MSQPDDLHARCLCQDRDGAYADPFDRDIGGYVAGELDWLMNPADWSTDGLDEICDATRDLVDFIMRQPTPHTRYQALVGVIGNVLEQTAPRLDPTEPTEPTPTP